MRRIPEQHGGKQCQRQSTAHPKLPAQQKAPRFGQQKQPNHQAKPQQRRRIFGQQRAPCDSARHQPPARITAAMRPRHGPKCRHPEEQQGRIGGHGHGAKGGKQRRIHQRRRPRTSAAPRKQVFRRPRQHQGTDKERHWPQKPHAQGAFPGHGRAQPDEDRDHWRMVQIAGLHIARPDPVISLIWGERQDRRQHQAQCCQRNQRYQPGVHFARQTSVAETA